MVRSQKVYLSPNLDSLPVWQSLFGATFVGDNINFLNFMSFLVANRFALLFLSKPTRLPYDGKPVPLYQSKASRLPYGG